MSRSTFSEWSKAAAKNHKVVSPPTGGLLPKKVTSSTFRDLCDWRELASNLIGLLAMLFFVFLLFAFCFNPGLDSQTNKAKEVLPRGNTFPSRT